MQIQDNQQLLSLSNEQLQVFLSGRLGDGCITTTNTNSTYYSTNCKYEEYIDFKISLLGNLYKSKSYNECNGFCKTPIYTMRSCSDSRLKIIKNLSIEEVLANLNELGLALWIYDIYPKLQVENKKDGRQFWYLRIGKYQGAAEISKILNEYPVNCYSYKRWSSETIQKWSKLQEELKRQGKTVLDFGSRSLSNMLNRIVL